MSEREGGERLPEDISEKEKESKGKTGWAGVKGGGVKRKGEGGRERGEKSGGTGGGLLRVRLRGGGGWPTSGKKEKDGSVLRNPATAHGFDHKASLARFVGLAGHSNKCSTE